MSDNQAFVDAIAAGVAAAMVKNGGAMQASPAIQQTSIDAYQPQEVTVRFTKWTQMNGTAYQREQMAGFTRAEIEPFVKAGRAVITHEYGEPVGGGRRR